MDVTPKVVIPDEPYCHSVLKDSTESFSSFRSYTTFHIPTTVTGTNMMARIPITSIEDDSATMGKELCCQCGNTFQVQPSSSLSASVDGVSWIFLEM